MPPPQPWWQQRFSPQQQPAPPQAPAPQQPQQEGWREPPTQPGFPQPDFPAPPGLAPPGLQQPGYQQPAFPPPGYQQPGFPPPPVPPPAAASRRRRPPIWALIVGVVALAGIAVGLFIWAPWRPAPQAPTAVHVSSPTATTALVSWTAPKGGATPAQYNVMRDGKEEGIVPGSQTSWRDTGLAPGSRHSYKVVTVGNGKQSAPSAAVAVTTMTPPPVGVTAADKTYTTVTLHWSAPPNAPAPDAYTIYDISTGNHVLASVAGSQTSYTATKLIPGSEYSFAVTAKWGSAVSGISQPVDAPPLSVPLSGSVPLNLKVTAILPQSHGLTVGETWTDDWSFSASCQAATCTITDKGSLISTVGPFTATLTPANGGYQGQATHMQFSHCGGVDSYETVVLKIYPDSGGVTNGAWTSWHGTMTLVYPGQSESGGACAGGDWALDLTSAGA